MTPQLLYIRTPPIERYTYLLFAGVVDPTTAWFTPAQEDWMQMGAKAGRQRRLSILILAVIAITNSSYLVGQASASLTLRLPHRSHFSPPFSVRDSDSEESEEDEASEAESTYSTSPADTAVATTPLPQESDNADTNHEQQNNVVQSSKPAEGRSTTSQMTSSTSPMLQHTASIQAESTRGKLDEVGTSTPSPSSQEPTTDSVPDNGDKQDGIDSSTSVGSSQPMGGDNNKLPGSTSSPDGAGKKQTQAPSNLISTTPVMQQNQVYLYDVKLEVTLPMSAQQFGAQERRAFMDAVARTAKVQPSQVSITNVISNRRGSRKLLATNSLTIECTIKVSEPNAVTRITKDMTIASLNQELARGGLPQSSSVAVVSKSSTSNGSSDTYLLIGCCIGGGFSLILFCLITRKMQRCTKARRDTFTYLGTPDPPPTAPPMPLSNESTVDSIEEEEDIPPPPPLPSNDSHLCFVQDGKQKHYY